MRRETGVVTRWGHMKAVVVAVALFIALVGMSTAVAAQDGVITNPPDASTPTPTEALDITLPTEPTPTEALDITLPGDEPTPTAPDDVTNPDDDPTPTAPDDVTNPDDDPTPTAPDDVTNPDDDPTPTAPDDVTNPGQTPESTQPGAGAAPTGGDSGKASALPNTGTGPVDSRGSSIAPVLLLLAGVLLAGVGAMAVRMHDRT